MQPVDAPQYHPMQCPGPIARCISIDETISTRIIDCHALPRSHRSTTRVTLPQRRQASPPRRGPLASFMFEMQLPMDRRA